MPAADPHPSANWAASRALIGQLARFAVAGGVSALCYSAAYLLAASLLPRRLAVLAVPPAFVVGVVSGFFLHSRWSFRGHDARGPARRRQVRFVLIQGFALALNASFTWFATAVFHGPTWVPLIPSMLVTPLVTFGLQRRWVFG